MEKSYHKPNTWEGVTMDRYALKEGIGLGIIYSCMVLVFMAMVTVSVILLCAFFLTGEIAGEAAGIKELFGGIYFSASAVGVAWCGVGMLRA